MTIPVIIEKSTARTPTDLFLVKSCFASNIREGSISVVVKQNVMPPERTKQIVPSVIVVVADADTGLPTSNP
jgi:hypothetical protein